MTHFRDGLSSEQKAIALAADLSADEEWMITADALLRACANEAKPEDKKP